MLSERCDVRFRKKSVKSDIESVENHVYGVEKSGAMLAWEYFFPDTSAPLAVQYVSDSDTWTHLMPDYKYVDAYIYKAGDNVDDIKYFDSDTGYEVYAVNAAAECRSETGHMLAEKTGTFGMCYYYIEGKLKVSLRSVKDFDCSLIAKEYGGGGHKNAASFFVKRDNPILSIINK